jgi:hypothetical protein
MNDLHAIGFDLGQVAQDAASALDGAEAGEPYRMAIKEEHVPVKKTVGDWLLFRGIATVRRRLFGEKLEQTIAPELKQKRLPENAREAFQQMIGSVVKEKFPELPAKFSERLGAAYVAKFRSVILERLRQQKDQFTMALAERQGPHDTIGAILAAMKELDEQSSKSVAEILVMAQQETGMPLGENGNKAATLPEGELTPAA